jgi:hypothetical protein
MKFNPAPCYSCSDRHFMCHSECKRHATWKAEENRRNAMLKKERAIKNGFVECETASYIRHYLRPKAMGART